MAGIPQQQHLFGGTYKTVLDLWKLQPSVCFDFFFHLKSPRIYLLPKKESDHNAQRRPPLT